MARLEEIKAKRRRGWAFGTKDIDWLIERVEEMAEAIGEMMDENLSHVDIRHVGEKALTRLEEE